MAKVLIIREVLEEDIPELSLLARKTYTETFGHSLKPEELAAELDATRSISYFQAAIKRDSILVYIKNNRLVGYIQLCAVRLDIQGQKPAKEDQAINALYVHSDFQGQGIGKALMNAAFAHPRFEAAQNIYIDVWDENKRAVNFYRQYGFQIAGSVDVIINGACVGKDLVLVRPVHIKPATISDLSSIISFDHVAAVAPERIEEIRQAINERKCWVYKKDSIAAGYAILNFHFFNQAFMPLVYVAPDFRRNGIAEALIVHLCAICRRSKFFTSTNQSNKNMQKLLEKLGFNKAGQVNGLDDDDPEIFYMKRI